MLEGGLLCGPPPAPEVSVQRLGRGASDGGLGRACRISQGCEQGWACRPRMPPWAVMQVHVPPNARSGRAGRLVLPLCRAMQMHPATPLSGGTGWPVTPAHLESCCFSHPHVSVQAGHAGQCCFLAEPSFNPHHPCCQIWHAGRLSALAGAHNLSCVRQGALQPCRYTLQPHTLCQAGMQTQAASLCSHRYAPLAPTSTGAPPLPLIAQCYRHGDAQSHKATQCCQAARQQMFGLPTSGVCALAAGAGARGRQLSRNLGTRRLNTDFLPDFGEQLASVAETECSTLAEFRFRGWLAVLVEAAAAAMPP